MKHLAKFKKKSILIALAISLSSHVQASSFRIEDIRVEGLQRVSASPVFAALPIASGDFADPESIRTAVRALFTTGFFDDIQVLQDGNVVIFRVKERPTISTITIEGNKAIKTEALLEAMKKNDLAEGQIFQRGTLDVILNEVERQYVAQGRYSAEITANIVDLPHNQVKVEVVVDEGKVATIKHINIVGNQIFSDEELLKSFELTTTGWLSWITSDDKYAREKLKGDIEKLESYYLDRGYLDFRVVSSQVSLSPDQKSVYITLNIHEGDIYTVKKIDLAGELIVPEEQIRRLVLLREGETFAQNLMTSTSEYMTTLLGNAGYTNAEVKGIPTPDPAAKTVDVTFLVNPSQRVYVRRIEFRGNTKTQDEVLRREMRQMEGSSASNAKIDQGKVRLERLGFFKGVNVEKKDVPGTSDLMDVEYSVEEQPSASINASVGYGQGTGFLLGASLQHNNWQGSGKQVGVSVNHSQYQTLYNFSYVDPYFTPDGVNRGISLYYSARDYSKINVASYTTDTYGLNFSFGYPISEIQRLNYVLGYSHLSVKTGGYTVQEIRRTPFEVDLSGYAQRYVREQDMGNFNLFPSGIYEDMSLPTGLVTAEMLTSSPPGFVDLYGDEFDTFTLGLSWLRSTLNRGILATRGSKQTLAFDISVPGSDLEYFTAQYDGQVFVPLYRSFTMRFRTSLGYGDGYGDMDRLPFFKNYYSGGFGSVRGFRRSSLGPQASAPGYYDTQTTDYEAIDSNGDGINDRHDVTGNAFILCDQAWSDSLGREKCRPGELMRSYGAVNTRNRAFGGNMLVEFGAELIFPLPFIEDQRSFQTALFLDVGNVFDTECAETQINCTSFDVDEMRASVGIGLNWLSPMGPLTFSLAKTLKHNEGDDREAFQFSLAAPF
ncbi:MAG: outer membrane protein assembly factor BamA [Cellvibrionaceae bacterium]|nr:outer membrane protein assembly factor BamA [Cellvibrionaceae bacterium]